MSGHSKWANIKHRKAAMDARKGQQFAKIIRELTVAAKAGGSDPESNPRLRKAIDKAREVNMPSDTVERAINRGLGGEEGANYEEVFYEGYGPAGVAILIRAVTDNRNRTSGDLKHLFSKYSGNLAEKGSVSWMFDKKGLLMGNIGTVPNLEFFDIAADVGAQDVTIEDGVFEVICDPKDLTHIKAELSKLPITFERVEITFVPRQLVRVEDEETAEKILRLVSMLEELDDVQEIYANYDIPAVKMEEFLGLPRVI